MATYKLVAHLDDGDKEYPGKFSSEYDAYRYVSEQWLMETDFCHSCLEQLAEGQSITDLLDELGFEAVKEKVMPMEDTDWFTQIKN